MIEVKTKTTISQEITIKLSPDKASSVCAALDCYLFHKDELEDPTTHAHVLSLRDGLHEAFDELNRRAIEYVQT